MLCLKKNKTQQIKPKSNQRKTKQKEFRHFGEKKRNFANASPSHVAQHGAKLILWRVSTQFPQLFRTLLEKPISFLKYPEYRGVISIAGGRKELQEEADKYIRGH